VECRRGDERVAGLLAPLDHPPSRAAVDAERAFLVELGGDCSLPAGAHATVDGEGGIHIRAVLGGGDRSRPVRGERRGDDGPALGSGLAAELRNLVEGRGAGS